MDLTIFIWIAALAAAALLAWVAAVFASNAIKRNMQAEADEAFTLQDLREMLSTGPIDESEYNTMRAAILGSLAAKLDEPPKEPAPDRSSDLEELLRLENQDERDR